MHYGVRTSQGEVDWWTAVARWALLSFFISVVEKAFSDLVGVARIRANHPHYAKFRVGTSRDAIDMDEE